MSAYRASAASWTLPVIAPERVAARRLASLVIGLLVTAVLFTGVGWLQLAADLEGPVMVLSAVASVIALEVARRLSTVPDGALRATSLSAEAGGRLVVGARTMRVRSFVYDCVEELLWVRTHLGLPLTVVKASRKEAWEIVQALQRPELGLRSLRGASGVVALPWVGFPLTLAVVFGAVAGIALAFVAPPWIGAPVCAVALGLAVFALWPAYLHVNEERVEWRWWRWTRRVPLASIAAVRVSNETLELVERGGRSRRFRMRHDFGGRWGDPEGATALRVFADQIEALRAGP